MTWNYRSEPTTPSHLQLISQPPTGTVFEVADPREMKMHSSSPQLTFGLLIVSRYIAAYTAHPFSLNSKILSQHQRGNAATTCSSDEDPKVYGGVLVHSATAVVTKMFRSTGSVKELRAVEHSASRSCQTLI